MAFEYKCVSGPTIVAVKSTKARDQAVKAFEDIMNAEAVQGWEFVGIDEFHVSEPEGLLSRKRVYVPAKILVFRREKAGSILADALKARSGQIDQSGTAAVDSQMLVTPAAQEALPAPEEKPASAGQSVSALIAKLKKKSS